MSNLTNIFNTLTALPSSWRSLGATVLSSIAPSVLVHEEKEIVLERHPLQNLYQLIEKHLKKDAVTTPLPQNLNAIPQTLRERILVMLDETGGNKDAPFADLGLLKNSIDKVAENIFDALQPPEKNAVYGTVYRLAEQPQTDDRQWGEHYVRDDHVRLIRALHRQHHLEIPGKEIVGYFKLEEGIQKPSCIFDLKRPNLGCGQIGFHNGMGCPFEEAKNNALHISNTYAHGYNLHCTYSATITSHFDLMSAALSQGGTIVPATLQLLEQWQDFFEKDDQHRLLQICTSRGAIEVENALLQLPKALQQRIIVISIAPACLIDPQNAYKALNLVIPHDPVVKLAKNPHLLDIPKCTWKLQNHNDSLDPHNMHGSSFKRELIPLIKQYMEQNDITI